MARRPSGPADWRRLRGDFGVAGGRLDRGAGLRFLLEPTSSPLRGRLLERILENYPQAKVTFYSAAAGDAPARAAERVFGGRWLPRFQLAQVERVFAVESDFLATGPFNLRYAHDFASTRRVESPHSTISRMALAESMPTLDRLARRRPSAGAQQ